MNTKNLNKLLLIVSFVLALPMLFHAISLATRDQILIPIYIPTIVKFLPPIILVIAALVLFKVLKENAAKKVLSIVVILQVLYILFFVLLIVSSPVGGYAACSSSNPESIRLESNHIPTVNNQNPYWVVGLINVTGSDISNVSCLGSGVFAGAVQNCPTETVKANDKLYLVPQPAALGAYTEGKIKINYKDNSGSEKSVTITCSGPITIS